MVSDKSFVGELIKPQRDFGWPVEAWKGDADKVDACRGF